MTLACVAAVSFPLEIDQARKGGARLGWAKNWGEVGRGWARRGGDGEERNHPIPLPLIFRILSRSFRPLRERLEKERNLPLPRLLEPWIIRPLSLTVATQGEFFPIFVINLPSINDKNLNSLSSQSVIGQSSTESWRELDYIICRLFLKWEVIYCNF